MASGQSEAARKELVEAARTALCMAERFGITGLPIDQTKYMAALDRQRELYTIIKVGQRSEWAGEMRWRDGSVAEGGGGRVPEAGGGAGGTDQAAGAQGVRPVRLRPASRRRRRTAQAAAARLPHGTNLSLCPHSLHPSTPRLQMRKRQGAEEKGTSVRLFNCPHRGISFSVKLYQKDHFERRLVMLSFSVSGWSGED